MHWRYEDVLNLPVNVYDVLVELLTEDAQKTATDGH